MRQLMDLLAGEFGSSLAFCPKQQHFMAKNDRGKSRQSFPEFVGKCCITLLPSTGIVS